MQVYSPPNCRCITQDQESFLLLLSPCRRAVAVANEKLKLSWRTPYYGALIILRGKKAHNNNNNQGACCRFLHFVETSKFN